MRRYFVRTTPWIVVVAVFSQGFVFAEDGEIVSESPRVELQQPVGVAETVVDESVTPTPRVEEDYSQLFRHNSYPAAWTAAQKSNRPILVYVSMPDCPYCVKMVKKTYELPAIERLVAGSFEPVYADRFTHAKLVKKLNIKYFPTTILVGPNNKVLDVINGYVEPADFRRRLHTSLAAVSTSIKRR